MLCDGGCSLSLSGQLLHFDLRWYGSSESRCSAVPLNLWATGTEDGYGWKGAGEKGR